MPPAVYKFSLTPPLSKGKIWSHHEAHEGHEGFGEFILFNFVLFVTFVVDPFASFAVKSLPPFGCGIAALGNAVDFV